MRFVHGPHRLASSLLALFVAVAPACSSTKASGTIALLTGGETDTFTRAPAPTELQVDAIDATGKATTLAKSALPATGLDLPDQPVDMVSALRVTGVDGAGATLVLGQSLPVQFGGLDGATLSIFVQRTGELARMPSPFAHGRDGPLAVPVLGRYVLLTGGADPASAAGADLYDLLTFATLASPPTFPRVPASLALFGTKVLLIDATGATWFDLQDSSVVVASAPSGGSFAEVAGGASVPTADGQTYVVGGTRATGDATARVLRVDTQGALSFVTLLTARRGAAAIWVDGQGVVIAGGAATGAGVEVLGSGATTAVALPYPSDATTGAGATALDATHVLLAGGLDATSGASAGVRAVDLACTGACLLASWTASIVPLASAQAFTLDANSALVVGGEPGSGATHVLRLATAATGGGTAKEIALKVPRAHAAALRLPTGTIAVVGGDVTMESFTP